MGEQSRQQQVVQQQRQQPETTDEELPSPELNVSNSLYSPNNMFIAGNIKNCVQKWQLLTSDRNILQLVRGCKLYFLEAPCQLSEPKPIVFNNKERKGIDLEIANMLAKGTIVES